MHVAVKSGNTAVVKSLIEFGGLGAAAQDKELIQLARESPSPQMVQLLLGKHSHYAYPHHSLFSHHGGFIL